MPWQGNVRFICDGVHSGNVESQWGAQTETPRTLV